MIYLDTSLIVAALSGEAMTPIVREWMASQNPDDMAISDWVVTEISSAFARKVRTGEMTLDQRARALSLFHNSLFESLNIVPVISAQFKSAASFADHYQLGLRGGDALHLAIASTAGATLATLDKRLAEAGRSLGTPTLLVGDVTGT